MHVGDAVARVHVIWNEDDANMPHVWHVSLQRAQRRANDMPAVR